MAFSKEKAHDRAERYAAKGQHDRAAREYLAIVEHDPKDVRAWLMLADCLVRCGDRSGAIERYLQVAGFYASQKQPQKALAVYRQVLNLDPGRLDILTKCAAINLELGRTPDAVAAYEQVAHAQLQSGHVAEALHTFALVADADPTVVSKRLRLAELFSREKQVDDAVDAFRKAGEELLRTDRKADFIRVAERLLYHKSDDKPTVRKLARVYLELGDARRALMKLNGLLQTDPHDTEGLELLAETFVALQKPDKAVSVLSELVRELRSQGPSTAREAIRVLERGLAWIPGNTELLRLQQELGGIEPSSAPADAVGAEAEADVSEPLELDEDDVVELDEDDVVMAESGAAPTPVPELGAPVKIQPESLTDTVLLEADRPPSTAVDGEGQTDVDKILFEARVYIKYRLFEHALDHVRDALEQDARHVGALGLKARALGELGRDRDSADAHVELARVVAERDPKLAREHVQAALQKVPDHVDAMALQARLGGAASGSVAEPSPAPSPAQPAPTGREDLLLEDGDGDSGAFDLVGDDLSSELLIQRAGASPPAEEPEFDISVSEPEETVDEPTQPVHIENRFGLSEAGPLPHGEGESEATVRERISQAADRTPASGFVARAPAPDAPTDAGSGEHLLGPLDGEEFADLLLEQSGAVAEGVVPEVSAELVDDSALELGELIEDSALELGELVDGTPEELGGQEAESSAEPLEVHEPPAPEPVEDSSPTPTPTPAAEPVAAAASSEPTWPDISDDLAEIRFYLDQGLDEDAEAALEDLRRKHGNHPDIVAIEVEMGKATAEPAVDEGAAPLVLLDDEDAEADAYLDSIFGGGDEDRPKETSSTEVVADVEGADTRTLFDLGTAYREMGLVDAAIAQFEAAAKDPQWQSRALVMLGTLRVHRGETDEAVTNLRSALETASTDDERCEASYELGVLYEKVGQTVAAIEQFQSVSAGFRDRDERLQALLEQ